MDDEVNLARSVDPGRGAFCAVDRTGVPQPFPPTRRVPVVDRTVNPRGVARPGKTWQDSLPVDKRPRVEAAKKRRERQGK